MPKMTWAVRTKRAFNRALLGTAFLTGALISAAQAQVTIGRNVNGTNLGNVSLIPPDTMGAIGVDHYVQFVNGRFAVYNKATGALISGSTVADSIFWTNAGAAWQTAVSDPRIVYDQASGRWFTSELDIPGGAGTQSNTMLIGVSNTSDPTAGFKGFAVDGNPNFSDFDMLGLNADSVTLSSNDFALTGGGLGQSSWINIPKADLLAAVPTVANRTTFSSLANGTRGSLPQGVISYGPSTGHAVMIGVDSTSSGSNLRRTNINGAAGAGATLGATSSVGISAFSDPPNGTQPSGSTTLETGDSRISSASFQEGDTIWMVHGTNVGGRDAIQWVKFSESANTVIQQGTISDPSFDFSYPSVAANADGDVVIGYSKCGLTENISAYASVGSTSGGVTTFASPMLLQAGAGTYEVTGGGPRNRWGDYSATSRDPSDPGIFWTTQEFVSSTNFWTTRITEIMVPRPGEARWKNNVAGTFGTGTNWIAGAAPGASNHTIFSRLTAAASVYTVTFDASYSNDRVSFRQGSVALELNGMTYNVANASATTPSITVGEFQSHPTATFQNGSVNSVNTAVAIHPLALGTVVFNNASVNNIGGMFVGGSSSASGGVGTVAINNSSLTIGGTLKVWNANSRVLYNSGSLTTGSIDVQAGQMILAAGGNKVVRTGAVNVTAGGKINLSDNDMIVNYTGSSPLANIDALITSAYNGGAWNGSGITSTLADSSHTALGFGEASDLGITTFSGQSVDSTSVLVRYTLYGDANLDGSVDTVDFNLLASSFSQSGTWENGDFNYDGSIDTVDFNLLGANFGQLLPAPSLASTLIPEPSGAMLLTLCASMVLRRRRTK